MQPSAIGYLCRNDGFLLGIRLLPHPLRHAFSKQFLNDNQNGLVSLAQIVGQRNLNTTSRFGQENGQQLVISSERANG